MIFAAISHLKLPFYSGLHFHLPSFPQALTCCCCYCCCCSSLRNNRVWLPPVFPKACHSLLFVDGLFLLPPPPRKALVRWTQQVVSACNGLPLTGRRLSAQKVALANKPTLSCTQGREFQNRTPFTANCGESTGFLLPAPRPSLPATHTLLL